MGTFWDGSGAALIGATTSALIAVSAVLWTRRDERQLLREEMSLKEAHNALIYLLELRSQVDEFILMSGGQSVDWAAAERLGRSFKTHAERISAFAGVIRPERLEWSLQVLDEWLQDDHGPQFQRAAVNRDRAALDRSARILGTSLTEIASECQTYLRSDFERDAIRRTAPWRRFRSTTSWPFVRRARPAELKPQRDDQGLPPRDY